jgi:hypothetical protein
MTASHKTDIRIGPLRILAQASGLATTVSR